MSYILDALKKADRERNHAKVPTLTTVHIPVYVTRRRTVIWVVGGVLLSGGLLAWFLQPSPVGVPVADVGPPTRIGVTPQPTTAPPEPVAVSTRPASAPAPPLVDAPPDLSTAEPRRETSRQPDRRPVVSPRASPPVSPQPSKIARVPIKPRPIESGPLPASRHPELQPTEGARATRPDTMASPPSPAAPVSPGLREAAARMTLDVFVYTDIEADRMVIINGRRYVRGQLVDGLYLVEEIAPEGAVLSYQGERVVLRP